MSGARGRLSYFSHSCEQIPDKEQPTKRKSPSFCLTVQKTAIHAERGRQGRERGLAHSGAQAQRPGNAVLCWPSKFTNASSLEMMLRHTQRWASLMP